MADPHFIRLADPLPCGVVQDGVPCGKFAKLAWASEYGGNRELQVAWLIVPYCSEHDPVKQAVGAAGGSAEGRMIG